MAVMAIFELDQQREELLGLLSKLLSLQSAQVHSSEDNTAGTYEFRLQVPITDANKKSIAALSAFSVSAAREA